MNDESVFPVGDTSYDAVYAQEAAMIDASELISSALESSGLSRADLARKLGISRAEITARLKGERNITVRKLAETLHALGENLALSTRTTPPQPRAVAHAWQLQRREHTHAVRRSRWTQPEEHHVG